MKQYVSFFSGVSLFLGASGVNGCKRRVWKGSATGTSSVRQKMRPTKKWIIVEVIASHPSSSGRVKLRIGPGLAVDVFKEEQASTRTYDKV